MQHGKEEMILRDLSELKMAMKPLNKTSPVYVTFTQDGVEKERLFDFTSHDSRQAFTRFISWAQGVKIPLTIGYTSTLKNTN